MFLDLSERIIEGGMRPWSQTRHRFGRFSFGMDGESSGMFDDAPHRPTEQIRQRPDVLFRRGRYSDIQSRGSPNRRKLRDVPCRQITRMLVWFNQPVTLSRPSVR